MKTSFRLACLAIFNFSFLFFNSAISQTIEQLQQLLLVASQEDKPKILNQLSEAYLSSDPVKSIDYAEQALKAARKENDADAETGALINLGDGYMASKNQKKSILYYKDAIKIFDDYNQPASSAYLWNKIADSYISAQKYSDALDANNTALGLFIKAKDKIGAATMHLEIGEIHFLQGKFEPAINEYKQAQKSFENLKDPKKNINALQLLGKAYSKWGNYDEAYLYLNQALEVAKKNKLSKEADAISLNLEKVKTNLSSFQKSQTEFSQQKEKQTQAQINILSAEKAKSLEEIEKLSYDAQLNELKIKARDDEIERKKMEAQSQTRVNDLLKKEAELQESELNKQKLIIWGAVGFSILGVLLTIFVFLAYRNKKKANDVLKQKNDIIYKQKEQIEQKNILITDSIDYAKNIQDAILPPMDLLQKHFPHSFILYKPKDIVSGDFFWMHEEPSTGCFYIAAADCTGHGVPGAFMSLLGFLMLDDIVRNIHVTPGEILKEVNKQLMEMLHQSNENTTGKFGMDVSLIKYDKQKKEIIFAGAHNPLIILNNGKINEVKADKVSIGTTIDCTFANNTVQVKEEDMIYLFSDGYQDQIGGEKRKKFLAFHLKEMLQQIHTLEPEKQKQELDKKHLEWRGKTEQTDDILIIGFKV